ncbi:hypothetical protein [Streptomyces sp. NPDC096030]|uniref:hypothetical protein n=1 Tax=Streptomyces sp. NPDC096030 TaxID=3155423 RepID=UPI0033169091
MSMRRKIATTVGATALAFAGVLGTAGQSFAGSNGQVLQFYDREGNTYSLYVVGTNQNGQRVDGCFQTPSTFTLLSGYWWKGAVSYMGFERANCTGPTTGAVDGWVPTYQEHQDVYTISL